MAKIGSIVLASFIVLIVMVATPPAGISDTINACYSKKSGAMRYVTSAAACSRQEVAISWNTEGQQGPTGPEGPQGPTGPIGPPGPVTNLMQIALNKWHVNTTATFPVGAAPARFAFDGAHMWVTNWQDDTVTKIRASDGAIMGTFAAGISPHPITFDGANIWVGNIGADSVTKIRASDGAIIATYAVGNAPTSLTFDGSSLWVTNAYSQNAMKLNPNNGAILGTFSM